MRRRNRSKDQPRRGHVPRAVLVVAALLVSTAGLLGARRRRAGPIS